MGGVPFEFTGTCDRCGELLATAPGEEHRRRHRGCDEEAAAAHKQTAHYAKWRDAVASMMAEPRSSVKYNAVFPDSQG